MKSPTFTDKLPFPLLSRDSTIILVYRYRGSSKTAVNPCVCVCVPVDLRASVRTRAVQFVLSKQATQFVLAVICHTTKPAETVQVQRNVLSLT